MEVSPQFNRHLWKIVAPFHYYFSSGTLDKSRKIAALEKNAS